MPGGHKGADRRPGGIATPIPLYGLHFITFAELAKREQTSRQAVRVNFLRWQSLGAAIKTEGRGKSFRVHSGDYAAARRHFGDPLKQRAPRSPFSTPEVPPVANETEARDAVALVGRVLAEEGMPATRIGLNEARAAEIIIKTRRRALELAIAEKKVGDLETMGAAVFARHRQLRDALTNRPARVSAKRR